jgi:hypothetical protein
MIHEEPVKGATNDTVASTTNPNALNAGSGAVVVNKLTVVGAGSVACRAHVCRLMVVIYRSYFVDHLVLRWLL